MDVLLEPLLKAVESDDGSLEIEEIANVLAKAAVVPDKSL